MTQTKNIKWLLLFPNNADNVKQTNVNRKVLFTKCSMSAALSKQTSATGSSQQNVDHVGRGKEQSNNATNKLRNYETFINTLFNLFSVLFVVLNSRLNTAAMVESAPKNMETKSWLARIVTSEKIYFFLFTYPSVESYCSHKKPLEEIQKHFNSWFYSSERVFPSSTSDSSLPPHLSVCVLCFCAVVWAISWDSRYGEIKVIMDEC